MGESDRRTQERKQRPGFSAFLHLCSAIKDKASPFNNIKKPAIGCGVRSCFFFSIYNLGEVGTAYFQGKQFQI